MEVLKKFGCLEDAVDGTEDALAQDGRAQRGVIIVVRVCNGHWGQDLNHEPVKAIWYRRMYPGVLYVRYIPIRPLLVNDMQMTKPNPLGHFQRSFGAWLHMFAEAALAATTAA